MKHVASNNPQGSRGSALDKALLVLNSITASEHPLGLAELTERLNLPRQTIHRTLQALVQSGMVLRAPQKDRYQVGPALTRLSIAALTTMNSTPPVRDLLQQLVDQTGETCNVGVLDQNEVVYIERIEGSSPLRLQLDVGSRVPFYCTAIGKLLAANQHKNIRSRLLRTVRRTRFTAHTLTDSNELEEEFTAIRKQGYSFNDEEYVEGLTAIAVPIRGGGNKTVAGLAVHAPVMRMNRQQAISLCPSMQDIAARIAANWWGDQ